MHLLSPKQAPRRCIARKMPHSAQIPACLTEFGGLFTVLGESNHLAKFDPHCSNSAQNLPTSAFAPSWPKLPRMTVCRPTFARIGRLGADWATFAPKIGAEPRGRTELAYSAQAPVEGMSCAYYPQILPPCFGLGFLRSVTSQDVPKETAGWPWLGRMLLNSDRLRGQLYIGPKLARLGATSAKVGHTRSNRVNTHQATRHRHRSGIGRFRPTHADPNADQRAQAAFPRPDDLTPPDTDPPVQRHDCSTVEYDSWPNPCSLRLRTSLLQCCPIPRRTSHWRQIYDCSTLKHRVWPNPPR